MTSEFYLPLLTLFATLYLPSPSFPYARTSDPPLLGHMFSFSTATHHAVLVNMAVLGMYMLWKGASATRLLNVHVALFFFTYLVCLFINFLIWETPTISWNAVMTGYWETGSGDFMWSPSDIRTVVTVPFVLFNLVLLPLALAQCPVLPGGCIEVKFGN